MLRVVLTGVGDTKYVPVRFPHEVYAVLQQVAQADRDLWHDHGGQIGMAPSVSAAVRQLVDEALRARGTQRA